jgi:hypothetical protein
MPIIKMQKVRIKIISKINIPLLSNLVHITANFIEIDHVVIFQGGSESQAPSPQLYRAPCFGKRLLVIDDG